MARAKRWPDLGLWLWVLAAAGRNARLAGGAALRRRRLGRP